MSYSVDKENGISFANAIKEEIFTGGYTLSVGLYCILGYLQVHVISECVSM